MDKYEQRARDHGWMKVKDLFFQPDSGLIRDEDTWKGLCVAEGLDYIEAKDRP